MAAEEAADEGAGGDALGAGDVYYVIRFMWCVVRCCHDYIIDMPNGANKPNKANGANETILIINHLSLINRQASP